MLSVARSFRFELETNDMDAGVDPGLHHRLSGRAGITIATFEMSAMIFYEAGLGFLGLSVPPSVPSWGNMLAEARGYLTIYPWMAIYPGLAIVFTGLGMNLLGDWLRDVLDPRMRRVKK